MILLNASRCVRTLAKESSCNKCETICPTNAIVIDSNPLPSINYSNCVDCGACDSICPNEALELDNFKPLDFFFSFMQSEENVISCKKNVPCIASLNVEILLSMALLKDEIVFDMGWCNECAIAHKCKPQIISIYEESTYLLEAFESKNSIKLQNVKYQKEPENEKLSRRELFSKANLQGIVDISSEFKKEVLKSSDELVRHQLSNVDIALLKKKRITNRRKLLFSALKKIDNPEVYHILEANELSFISMKLLDQESCTACQMCYRVCPSGALSSDIRNSKIDFDPLLCIKCHTCHDVCLPNSLTISPSFAIKDIIEQKVYNLIKFNVRRCNECNMIFSSNGDDLLCYRCKAEEEEARELWGLN